MIELGKKYQTRDGREVRIYAVDGCSDGGAVHGAYLHDGEWHHRSWREDGVYAGPLSPNASVDLIEVKPEHTRWFLLSPDGGYATREEAIADIKRLIPRVDLRRHALKQETFREGEGL